MISTNIMDVTTLYSFYAFVALFSFYFHLIFTENILIGAFCLFGDFADVVIY